jgi:hypothetical protein
MKKENKPCDCTWRYTADPMPLWGIRMSNDFWRFNTTHVICTFLLTVLFLLHAIGIL